MKGFIYILHFDIPLCHAQHYTGSTMHLKRRLHNHANGHGSALCRELHRLGTPWRLGGLYTANQTTLRKIERQCKDQHNAKRFCEICTPIPNPPQNSTAYPIDETLCTTLLRPKTQPIIIVQHTPSLAYMQDIKKIMKASNDALGFIPIGGEEGFCHFVKMNTLITARVDGQLTGYACYTIDHTKKSITIHQTAVDDRFRLMGIGAAMISEAQAKHDDHYTQCHVRDDLPANDFWKAIGFRHDYSKKHKTSGSTLNHYTTALDNQDHPAYNNTVQTATTTEDTQEE